MLIIKDQEHFDEVKQFAEKTGRMDQLQSRLDYLDTYAEHGNRGATRCALFKDWAPYSFEFVVEKRGPDGEYKRWFNGGLIFHGTHDNGGDGGAPTFSVYLSPIDGWAVHS